MFGVDMTLAEALQRVSQQLQQGHYADALSTLQPLSERYSSSADVWQLQALAYRGLGEGTAAEVAFLNSIEIAPQPHVITNLANLYRSQGRASAALERYDQALAGAPDHLPACVNRARTLLDLKQFDAAMAAFEAILQRHPGHRNATLGLAQALQQMGRQDAALGLFETVLAEDGDNPVALNGKGISLKTLGYVEEAVTCLLAGTTRAPEAPELYVNLASALAQADRQEEAVAAYQQALQLDPDNLELHDWCNGYLGVIDHPDYLKSYRTALARRPDHAGLAIALARKLLLNDRGQDALDVLDAARAEIEQPAAIDAERSHVHREQGHFDEALDAARAAAALAPEEVGVTRELATALMAAGADYHEARQILERLIKRYPEDQGLWALFTTALRYTGDWERYQKLVDYDRWVQVRQVEPAPGFADREAFVIYLREQFDALHTTQRHPVEQSAVNGTQTLDDLFSRRHEAISLLKTALGDEVSSVIRSFPASKEHPLLSRNQGGLRFSDSWSIKLRQRGYHKNHFHSQGWLSSAFYLRVPDSINFHSVEGWIKFGEPGFRAREPLQAEYWIRPEEGTLVVFPSYLWHGTEPLREARERMSVGYDILPDSP